MIESLSLLSSTIRLLMDPLLGSALGLRRTGPVSISTIRHD